MAQGQWEGGAVGGQREEQWCNEVKEGETGDGTGLGWAGSAKEACCHIISSLLGLQALHRASWTCTRELAGAVLSSPVEQVEA